MKEHVIINRDRTVIVPESLKKIGIQFDHNVNTITFDCPRYPDEDSSIDMSQMPIFINYMLPDKTPGSSLALNVVVDETDVTLMHFDWKITNAITPVNGVLSTLICVKQSDTEGNELYHWNTDLFQKFTVGNGMECNGQVAEMNPDVISQLLARMGEVDTRTSTEAMSGYVNEYMTKNPPQPTDEQVGSGVNAYMTSNGQTHVNAYMTENQELVQNSVDDYLGRNPLQLDETLTDSTKAAPADLVGELKGDLVEFMVVTENTSGITIENNKYVDTDNGNFVSHSSASPHVVSGIYVTYGNTINLKLSYVPAGGVRGIAFYDEDGRFISGKNYTVNIKEYSVIVPKNSYKMALTTFGELVLFRLKIYDGVNSVSKKLSDLSLISKYDNTEDYNGFFDIDNKELYASSSYRVKSIKVVKGQKLYVNTRGFTHNSAGVGLMSSKGFGVVSTHKITNSIFELEIPNRVDYVLITYSPSNGISVRTDIEIKDIVNENNNNPFDKLDTMPTFITMFRKIVCIGDSLTRGEFDITGSGNNDRPEFSYPSNLAKMTGVNVVNLGIGSHSASRSARYPWIITALSESNPNFKPSDFTTNPADAYIIALGTNDISELGDFTGDVNTDINDSDYMQNAHTSVGGYAEIIQRILEMQPKAKIFCVTIPQTRNNATTRLSANTKIKALAGKFGCYVIDLEMYAESEKGTYKTYYKNASHNNCLGCNLRAREYIAYIDWIIENNLDEFRNCQFIGTDTTWTPS